MRRLLERYTYFPHDDQVESAAGHSGEIQCLRLQGKGRIRSGDETGHERLLSYHASAYIWNKGRDDYATATGVVQGAGTGPVWHECRQGGRAAVVNHHLNREMPRGTKKKL